MNDSMTHSRFTCFITERISVFEWISWMNDSMTHSRFTCFITEWISVFEWISWMNDSMTHSRFICFITGWISGFEWMIQWLTQDSFVSLLDESVVLNEWFNDSLKIYLIHYWINQCFWMNLLNEWFNDSLKIHLFHYWMNQWFWMNDSMTHSRFTCFITGWISVFEWISWMNDSMTHSRLICFITEWISVFEWISLMNDSKTIFNLTNFKYPILELELIFDSQPYSWPKIVIHCLL